jgi:hypothetical protein
VFNKLQLAGRVTRSPFPEGKQHRIDVHVGARSGLAKDNPDAVLTRSKALSVELSNAHFKSLGLPSLIEAR